MSDATRIDTARKWLAEYLREKACYRRRLAETLPWTGRKNGNYAESLERVAGYIESLPGDDDVLQRLGGCTRLFLDGADDVLCLPDNPEISTEAVHCGPRGQVIEPSECAAWFARWAELIITTAAAESRYGLFGAVHKEAGRGIW